MDRTADALLGVIVEQDMALDEVSFAFNVHFTGQRRAALPGIRRRDLFSCSNATTVGRNQVFAQTGSSLVGSFFLIFDDTRPRQTASDHGKH